MRADAHRRAMMPSVMSLETEAAVSIAVLAAGPAAGQAKMGCFPSSMWL